MTAQIARARKPKAVVPTEHSEQVCLMQWARLATCEYPDLRLLYAIPNAAKRSPRLAAHMKAEGLRCGVPDLCLPVARGGYHGLYIELKRRKGGSVSAEQKVWIDLLNKQKYKAVVCHGWEMARVVLRAYLGATA
ncbi:hypothetical protein FHW84_001808 [Dyella sp. SG562]|uniref:VRR-NUC domain-containing protein n=1 Tax=Dyella sp. SG562 TaxID=2587017 RepID=UPI001422E6FA|nr:VRR-NUC domain-containing protein [Dyella sp. SG562]NII73239.1 hypothetical protein [Dyella sp. SG562]